MQIALRRRLRLPLPLAPLRCGEGGAHGCGRHTDEFGDHSLACPRTGLLARRAKGLEWAWVRVACEAVGPEGRVVPQTDARVHLPPVFKPGTSVGSTRGLLRDCLWGRTLLRCHPRIPAHTTRRAPGARRFRGWRGAAFGRAPQTNHLPRALRRGPAAFACVRGGGGGPLELGGAQLVSARQPPCGGAQPAGGCGVGGASWPWPCNKLWARPRLAKPCPQPRSGPPGRRQLMQAQKSRGKKKLGALILSLGSPG